MKSSKLFSTIIMAIVLMFAMVLPAAAVNYSDVADNAWYAEAVQYCQDNGLMNGTSDTEFSPNGTMTRAMLATALYRQAGSPAVTGSDNFTDTADNTWYSNAVNWAYQQKIITGYTDTVFGTDDSVTREDIVTILWRMAESPELTASADSFADRADISSYAAKAVAWAKTQNLINGKEGNRFDPKGNATRAEVAQILTNHAKGEQPVTPAPQGGKALVVYYSATGSTERVAGYIAGAAEADTFELVPVNPYTDADLNYGNSSSRVVREHDNPDQRNVALTATTPDNWASYDTVFIGYPIWWGIAAWPVDNFVKGNDFTGKTVIPFCTSASSGLGQSGTLLRDMANSGNWQEGIRFSSGASESTVTAWVNGLNLK